MVHKIVHKYKLMIDKRILRHFIAHKNVHVHEMMIDKQILRRDDAIGAQTEAQILTPRYI